MSLPISCKGVKEYFFHVDFERVISLKRINVTFMSGGEAWHDS
jgi:hypothetical protein